MTKVKTVADTFVAYAKTKLLAASETINKPEILEPVDRTVFGDDPIKIHWKGSQTGSESDNFFHLVHREGNFSIEQLQFGKEEFEVCIKGESELAIWNIASNGQIAFSNTIRLGYDPNFMARAVQEAEN